MNHGSQSYFDEHARNGRRLAILSATIGLVALVSLALGGAPRVKRVLNDPKRFGLEGPEQYVRRITLDAPPSPKDALRALGSVREHSARRGGAARSTASRSDAAVPETRAKTPGVGAAIEDLLARTYSRRADIPLVQEEDLVFEKFLPPVYPEHVRDASPKRVRVPVIALVDTTGRVVEVQVLPSDPIASRAFGEAASEAVWRAKFRPYRIGGKVTEVYGQFTFTFTRED
jgi:TonB family protein